MRKTSFYIVNGITLYRLVAVPVLLMLVFNNHTVVFRWLLPVSFFTDAIDGYFARRYKVNSVLGAKLDSIADDLTIAMAMTAMVVLKPAFFRQQSATFLLLLILFTVQVLAAMSRYGKMTSFHTYGAKAAAVLQGSFFSLFFLLPQPVMQLFYLAVIVTALELLEEIIIVAVIPCWQTDVKGLWWILRSRQKQVQTKDQQQ